MKTDSSEAPLKGMLLISIAVILFAVMDTLSKYMTQYYPPSNVLLARYLFHTLLIVTALTPKVGKRLFKTQHLPIHLIRGLMLSIASLFFISAVKYMPLAEATAIQFLAPLIVTILAVFFLKEKMTPIQWAAVIAGFLGVLIVIRPGSGIFSWYAFLPLCTALLFASYQVITRKLAGREHPYTSIFYPGLVGTLVMAIAAIPEWTPPQNLSHCALLALAGMVGGASHLILIQAYEYAPASKLAPFSYAQLIWVTLTGYLVFDQLPDRWSFLGIGILATSGVSCALYQKHLQAKHHQHARTGH